MEIDLFFWIPVSFAFLVLYLIFSILDFSLSSLSRVDIKVMLEAEKKNLPRVVSEQLQKGKFRLQIPLRFFLQLQLIILSILAYMVVSPTCGYWAVIIVPGIVIIGVTILNHGVPSLVARGDPQAVFMKLRSLIPFVYYLMLPLSFIVYKIVGKNEKTVSAEDSIEEVTDQEVQAYLDVGEEEGIFEQEETRMIQQVVEFGDTIVREIMVPRTEIVAINENATKEELKNLMVESSHSRIPVYGKTIDSIIGIVYVRHLLSNYDSESCFKPITDLIRPAFFIPETKKVSDLLREMQSQGEHMAIIVDEYGGVAGLATLEDVIEEIVGEIRDEDQFEEESIQDLGNGIFILQGDTDIDEIENTFHMDLDEEGYNTIAGMIIKHLGSFPKKGEIIEVKGLKIQVLDVDNRKIHRVKVQRLNEEKT